MNVAKQPKDFMKSLQIIHGALLFGVVAFCAYVAIDGENRLFFSYTDGKAFLYLAIIIAFIGNLTSKYLYAKMLNQIPKKAALSEKAIKYSTAHVYRMAMLEFPALMCVIFTFQSNNSFYFILVGVLVFMMLVIYPTKNKFANDLELSDKEKSMLEKL